MSYNSPNALRAAVSSRARNKARETGDKAGDLVTRFYLSRLMQRVFHHDPANWMLKGGQALLVRWPHARHSSDIDLLATSSDGLAQAVERLRAAAALDLDDLVRFEYISAGNERQEGAMTKVKFYAYCGSVKAADVSVDVVTGRYPHGQPARQLLRSPIDIELGDVAATAYMWPLEDHVADKIAAMYEVHKPDRASSRYRDLVDLVIIACSSDIGGRITHQALRAEVQRRNAQGIVQITLPGQFTVPADTWSSGYAKAAKDALHLDERYRTLRGATPLADRFVSPLLAADPPGRWDHTESRWI